jgi:hypothetical protein
MKQKTTEPKQSSTTGNVHGRQFHRLRSNMKSAAILLAMVLAGVCTENVRAQGDIPSGSISGSGSGPYIYNLIFSDSASATSPVGSIWYGWIPGQFFLPGTPTSASAPFGWTASVVANSIQFTASSSIYDITPGQSLPGFSYQASFSPSALAAAPNSGESDAYVGGIETDAGKIFTVTVPEPSSMALFSMSALGLAVLRRRGLRLKG